MPGRDGNAGGDTLDTRIVDWLKYLVWVTVASSLISSFYFIPIAAERDFYAVHQDTLWHVIEVSGRVANTFFPLLAIAILGFIVFWLTQVYRRIEALGLTRRFPMTLAIAFFVIPVVNFAMPYFVLNDLWAVSGRDGSGTGEAGEKKGGGPGIVTAWWIVWLLMIMVPPLFSIFAGTPAPEDEERIVAAMLAAIFFFYAVQLPIFYTIIKRITTKLATDR